MLTFEGSLGSRVTLDWGSRRQSTSSVSSAASELFGMSYGAGECISFLGFLTEHLHIEETPTMAGDNMAALRVIRKGWSPAQKAFLQAENASRRRTAVLRCRYLNDCVAAGLLRLAYVHTDNNLADGGTKTLGRYKFDAWRRQLGVCATTNAVDRDVKGFALSYMDTDSTPEPNTLKATRACRAMFIIA